ncbi:hypothetical protein LguiA_033536 [Lonicera macranthoides]
MGGGKDKNLDESADKGLFSHLGQHPPGQYPPQPGTYPPQGYPLSGYPQQGQGYPPAGYPPQQGYPPAGYPPLPTSRLSWSICPRPLSQQEAWLLAAAPLVVRMRCTTGAIASSLLDWDHRGFVDPTHKEEKMFLRGDLFPQSFNQFFHL